MTNTKPPVKFVAGETLEWMATFSDYPASEGWELSYQFRSGTAGETGGFDVTAEASGDDFAVTVAAADTENLAAGTYYFRAFVELDDVKKMVDEGSAIVRAAFDASGAVDLRSDTKKTLDAIRACISGKAANDQFEYTINNRSLRRYSFQELLDAEKYYAQKYALETHNENTKSGKTGFFKTVHTRFTRPQ